MTQSKPIYWVPTPDEHGMTELHYAAYCQDLEAVRKCVEEGADIGQKDNQGWTALIWAVDMASTGDVGCAESIVDYLVSKGASLKFSDEYSEDIVSFAQNVDAAVAEHLEKMLGKKNDQTGGWSKIADSPL